MVGVSSCRLHVDQLAFSSVGIDFFGPLNAKQGRLTVKRYGCVFTCLTMRAIHIEIAHSLNTDSFLHALRSACRGTPKQIFSDNGTNFVGAVKILKDSLQSLNFDKIDHYCFQRNIKWNFNPPTPSHMGGA